MLLCSFKGLVQTDFRLITATRFEKQFAPEFMQPGRTPAITALVSRFTYEPQSILNFSGNEMRFRCPGETVRNVKFRPCCTPRGQPFPHDGEALHDVSLHNARPAAQHGRVRDFDGRPMARE